ncbi:MAG: 4-hydroxy-tetrahydrodipicolinate reductase [Lachnospiraceae bacterium]|nr:4-hydroxy-tetrahydrodipicolinate reductase [Lachnospiraceae bacterium]
MVKIIMHGCNGRMGQFITSMAAQDPECEIVAGIDVSDHIQNTYPVFTSVDACDVDADVIIDFSTAKAIDALMDYSEKRNIPCVYCSTGLSEEQNARLQAFSGKVAVFKSANMSVGINLLMKLVKDAAKTLAAAGFDMEIVEKHHNQKLDAPSGTALALADSINEEFDGAYEYVYDRSTRRAKRPEKEIGISAVRGGTIVGDHDVIFAGTQEVVTLSHTAYSREVFAKGALEAAKFMKGRTSGYFTMADVIG